MQALWLSILEQLTWKQAVGVVAFALNVWGNLELTKVGNRGHIIRLCSNAAWLIYSPLVGAWALFLNHMTFAGINVLGYKRWKRLEKSGLINRSKTGMTIDQVNAVLDEFGDVIGCETRMRIKNNLYSKGLLVDKPLREHVGTRDH